MAVELGTMTLEHLTSLKVSERARVVGHDVPSLAGDLVQQLGRSSVHFSLSGMFFGAAATEQLAALRKAYRSEQRLDLLADAVGQGYVAKVVVTGLDVSQHSSYPESYAYRVALVEYVEPPAAPGLDSLASIDTSLAGEAMSYIDDVQNALGQVSQLVAIAGLAGFGDPTTKAPKMLEDYKDAGGGRTEPAADLRELL